MATANSLPEWPTQLLCAENMRIRLSPPFKQREARLKKECERQLLEKELPVKSKVGEKIIAAHIQLKKELRIL